MCLQNEGSSNENFPATVFHPNMQGLFSRARSSLPSSPCTDTANKSLAGAKYTRNRSESRVMSLIAEKSQDLSVINIRGFLYFAAGHRLTPWFFSGFLAP